MRFVDVRVHIICARAGVGRGITCLSTTGQTIFDGCSRLVIYIKDGIMTSYNYTKAAVVAGAGAVCGGLASGLSWVGGWFTAFAPADTI